MKKLMLLSVMLLGLAGCRDVEIVDGKIPQEYLNQAALFVGSYQGHFEGVASVIQVSLEGDRLVMGQHGQGMQNFLNGNCQATVGHLTKLHVEENNGQHTIKSATFAFSPNHCSASIEADTVEVAIRSQAGGIVLKPSVLENMEWVEDCYIEVGPGGDVRQRCDRRPVYNYLKGEFIKN